MRTLLLSSAAMFTLTMIGCAVRTGDIDDSGSAGVEGAGGVESQAFGGFAPEAPIATPPAESHCSPAPALARNALCACGSLKAAGALRTEARVAGQAANVGIHGSFTPAAGTEIGGSLRANGPIATTGSLSVAGHLFSRSSIDSAGSLEVNADLASGGDLVALGTLDVGGTLRVAGRTNHLGSGSTSAKGAFVDPGTQPCGCDAPYDVGAAVALARTTNDNAAHALSAEGVSTLGASELMLSSGRYYVKGLESIGARRVHVTGAVQLYLDGDLVHVGSDRFDVAPGASLDLFVAGSVASVGSLALGDASRPEAFRLYVGGGGRIDLTGSSAFHGVVYAPEADLNLAGASLVEGSLFARNISYAGSLTVRYSAITEQGDLCEEPAVPPPPSAPAIH